LYGSENIVEKATISPTISENSSIYISENTLVYTSDDLKNNRPANVQNIKNTKISPQKNSSKASSLIARKKLLKNSKALAYTAPQKSSPHKISKIPMSENFFTRHFQTEAAFFIPRVDHLSEAVRTSYLYSRKIPCTLESGKIPTTIRQVSKVFYALQSLYAHHQWIPLTVCLPCSELMSFLHKRFMQNPIPIL
jgi:hypothetical protein